MGQGAGLTLGWLLHCPQAAAEKMSRQPPDKTTADPIQASAGSVADWLAFRLPAADPCPGITITAISCRLGCTDCAWLPSAGKARLTNPALRPSAGYEGCGERVGQA